MLLDIKLFVKEKKLQKSGRKTVDFYGECGIIKNKDFLENKKVKLFLHYRKLRKIDLAVLRCLDTGKTTIG